MTDERRCFIGAQEVSVDLDDALEVAVEVIGDVAGEWCAATAV
jgi:hypothetical protein